MAAIYSNGGNRWNILGFNFTNRDALSSVYKILWAQHVMFRENPDTKEEIGNEFGTVTPIELHAEEATEFFIICDSKNIFNGLAKTFFSDRAAERLSA